MIDGLGVVGSSVVNLTYGYNIGAENRSCFQMGAEERDGSDLLAGGIRNSERSARRLRTSCARLASARLSSSSCTTSAWPSRQAIWSAVVPFCSVQQCVFKTGVCSRELALPLFLRFSSLQRCKEALSV